MKLQVAYDLLDMEEMKKSLENLHPYIDIVEVGTPMIIRYGLEPVKYLANEFSDINVLADCKIMDGGYLEAKWAFEAGASIVSCCASAPNETIEGAFKAAKEAGKELLVDLINVKGEKFKETIVYLDTLGVHYICVHTAADVQSKENNPIEELKTAKGLVNHSKISVAGGISLDTIEEIKLAKPDVLIIGSAIHHSENAVEMCRTFYEQTKS